MFSKWNSDLWDHLQHMASSLLYVEEETILRELLMCEAKKKTLQESVC
jgi:hypothetical protein